MELVLCSLKDHLGVVWRGSMGCLTMSYLGESWDDI